MKFKSGFTLAEIGISVLIIGIIVAIVTPATIVKFQNASMIVLLKKAYVELEEKLTEIQTHRYYKGNLHNSIVMNNEGRFLKENFTYTLDCGTNTSNGCFASSYKNLDSASSERFAPDNCYSLLLKSGSAICIIPPANNDVPATVYLDVNGQNGPNIGGRDMFTFEIAHDFSIGYPEYFGDGEPKELAGMSCTDSPFGDGCLEYLMQNDWKMDY